MDDLTSGVLGATLMNLPLVMAGTWGTEDGSRCFWSCPLIGAVGMPKNSVGPMGFLWSYLSFETKPFNPGVQ